VVSAGRGNNAGTCGSAGTACACEEASMSSKVIAPTLALLLITAAHGAKAQDLAFDQLSVEHGLASPWVLAILKDSSGFVWIGTSDGLHRFDGRRVVRYKVAPKPDARWKSSMVQYLHEDRKGRLWLALADGVQRYDREHDRLEHVALADAQGPDFVQGIAEDASGTLWFAAGRGLVSLDPETGRSRRFFGGSATPGPEDVINSVLADRRGALWLLRAASACGFPSTRPTPARRST
jgi:streptogramin lyase